MGHPNDIVVHPSYARLMRAANAPPLNLVFVVDVAKYLTGRGIEVSPQQLGNWKTRGVPGWVVIRVAEAIGVSPVWLAEGKNESPPPVRPVADHAELISAFDRLSPKEQARVLLEIKYRVDLADLESAPPDPKPKQAA